MGDISWPIHAASIEFTAKYKLPVEFDTATQILLSNETYEEEDDAFNKVATIPSGVLVVRIYGCTDLSNTDFRTDAKVLVYARASTGSMGKSTHHTPFSKGEPFWNEMLFFPIQFNGNLTAKSNRLSVLIVWRDEAEDNRSGISKHFLLGQADFRLNQLASRTKVFQTVDITDKKLEIVGKLKIEMVLLYGAFGFGHSTQVEDRLYRPEEMVKLSLYPKVQPSYQGPQCRGAAAMPKKLKPPACIPFHTRAENLEPAISETYGSATLYKPYKTFPTLASHLHRLHSLQEGLLQQKTRTHRLTYLRGILRSLDKYDSVASEIMNQQNALEPPNIILQSSVHSLRGPESHESLHTCSDVESQSEMVQTNKSFAASLFDGLKAGGKVAPQVTSS